ncbi:MAG: hypothetical protein LBU19_02515 [Treponema sp.]|jgi:transketolase|nr:hypothetical protein [Treponema sp.]
MASEQRIRETRAAALRLRYDLLEMIGVGTAGYLGGSASLAELMAALYFFKLNLDKDRPDGTGLSFPKAMPP